MDPLYILVYKMAIRLMEMKVLELEQQIAHVGQFDMSADTVTRLIDKKISISGRITLFKDALANNRSDQIQSDIEELIRSDLF